jgi:hypothetical protein
MHARLARCFPDIHSNVVSVGTMLLLDCLLNLSQQCKDGRLFVCSHVEKVCHMALRNYEHVPAAQRIAVVAHVSQRVLKKHFVPGT